MKEDKKESNFLELLRLNDQEKVKNFVVENGKEPKIICPIMFIKKGDSENDDDKEYKDINSI